MEVATGVDASVLVPVHEASQVADLRRRALALAERVGLSRGTRDDLAVVASEGCTNLVKHARQGACILRALSRESESGDEQRGIELLFLDRGPGMANVAACMVDGYSTGGSMGTGFGAMRRLASAFDVYSQPGSGTVMAIEMWDADAPRGRGPRRIVLGGISVAKRGEDACGDGWGFASADARTEIAIVDGLGHGRLAAFASQRALAELSRRDERDVERRIADLDGALHGTRGAAAAVASIDPRRGVVRYAGIGNTSGLLQHAEGVQRTVSHPGTLGAGVRQVGAFEYRWTPQTVLVLHTDGVSARFDLERYPGLRRRHPSVVAGVLFRDFAREHDDATVLVACERE